MVTWTFAVYILVERVYVTEPVAGSQLKDFGYICGLDKLLDTWHNFITLAGWRVLLCRQSFSPFPPLIYHPNFVTSTRIVELFRVVHWVIITVYTRFLLKIGNYIHSRHSFVECKPFVKFNHLNFRPSVFRQFSCSILLASRSIFIYVFFLSFFFFFFYYRYDESGNIWRAIFVKRGEIDQLASC